MFGGLLNDFSEAAGACSRIAFLLFVFGFLSYDFAIRRKIRVKCFIILIFSANFVQLFAISVLRADEALPNSSPALRMIVPAPPGGGTDIFARSLATSAEAILGRRIFVDNRAGAGGAVGVTLLTTAPADGNTVAFIWNGPLTAAPLMLPVTYTQNAYKAILSIGYSSYVLCAPSKDVGEDSLSFVTSLKTRSGLTYSNDGTGGTMQLAAERVFRKLGIVARGVPFSGASESARNFNAGYVDLYGGSLPPILPSVKSGKTKCFMVTSARPIQLLPDAVSLDQLGLGSDETVLWWGLIAPARVPKAELERLQSAFMQAAQTEEFRNVMARQGAILDVQPGPAMEQRIKSELAALTDVARDLGVLRMGQ